MGRSRSLCLLLAASLSAAAMAQTAPAAPTSGLRAPPTRPAAAAGSWKTVRLQGVDFVDLREVAEKYGWKAEWTAPGRKLKLSAGRDQAVTFESDERDCHFNGVRLFLSEHVVAIRESLWIARLDLQKTIAPLLRPADQTLLWPTPPRLIVLDAGHGGTDTGKHNERLKLNEKDMTLDVVLRLQKLLEARGYRVLLTRKDDTRFASNPIVDLQRRADFANKASADLFLSVHFNAVEPRDAQRVDGSETYVLTPKGMLSTSDDKKDELTDVNFPGNRYDLPNVLLGYQLHSQLISHLKTADRGYKRARFAVLRFVECPAALIEAAYLSHDEEAARVAKPGFRQEIAEAIARGVDRYADALRALHEPRKGA